jgi:hypothetical protein
MPSYLSIHRAATREQLPSLLAQAEALLSRPTADVTIRNVAVVPRTRYLYVHANASAAGLVARLLAECGLAPVSIAEAGRVKWGRLIGALPTTVDPLEPDDVMAARRVAV